MCNAGELTRGDANLYGPHPHRSRLCGMARASCRPNDTRIHARSVERSSSPSAVILLVSKYQAHFECATIVPALVYVSGPNAMQATMLKSPRGHNDFIAARCPPVPYSSVLCAQNNLLVVDRCLTSFKSSYRILFAILKYKKPISRRRLMGMSIHKKINRKKLYVLMRIRLRK